MNLDAMKLQILMGKQGMTSKELAERSSVSRQTISYIKSGKSCTPIVACKIAEALEDDVTEILA